MYYPIDFVFVRVQFEVNPQSSQMKNLPKTVRNTNSEIGKKMLRIVGITKNPAIS